MLVRDLIASARSKLIRRPVSKNPVVNGIILPILLLSGILLPMTLAPGWLQTVADVNSLTYLVDGVRVVYRGDGGSGAAWLGAVLTLGLIVVGVFYGARVFRKESA